MDSALIERFFIKQCTPLEAKRVALYLKANPSVLEKYLSTDEWNNVAYCENFSQGFRDELLLSVKKKNKARIINIRLKRFAAAASVILIIAAIYYLQTPSKPEIKIAAKTTLPAFKQQIISNKTKETMHVVLPDSSVVMLAPASSIKYTAPFQNNKREILLEGEAEFHVTKNKLKPFTVYAGTLATTALGTIFSIKKNDKKSNITVKLFKGKVIIQSTDKNLKGWHKDVYLLPGDQLNFNIKTALLTVNNNSVKSDQTTSIKIKSKQAGTDSLKDELLFNNEKLPVVLNKLAVFYNVQIQYDSLVIDTMNFTGTISKNDSIPVILKAISEMNNLEIIQNDKKFMIQKPAFN